MFTAAAVALLSSCNMDLAPIGLLDDENAIESPADLLKARNGIYESLRSMSTGAYLYCGDIQMDQFLGIVINGNQNGIFAHGNIFSNNSSIEDIWAGCYANIADANYLLGHAGKIIDNPELTDADLLEAKRYVAETKFARAYYYYYLFDKFCESYTAEKGDVAAKGLPLVTVFNPTGDIASYPGRSTMNETFALIDQDLEDAYTELKAYETETNYGIVPMSAYVNSYTVLALQARLALLRQDYATAATKAKAVIDSGYYTLANTDDYEKMWTDDYSDEIIFRPISTKTELGIGSTGGAYIDSNPELAYYLPTNENLDAYEYDPVKGINDIRFDAYFTVATLKVNGTGIQAYVFNKFPGNKALYTSTENNLRNMGKPFRLSEMYLILAEASYENATKDEATANSALNTLRKNRIEGYEEVTYPAAVLRQEIRAERTKELIGEGFRLSDLRRWGLGFTRDASYPQNPIVEDIFVKVDTEVEYVAGDHRYVWPIPNTEMENNPQLKGQQNPGY